ncbi:elongation factor Ts [Caulobacter ginsengisoli]|uniref:Elongation factor Ts n=1 Tax=Caulobacter ginsengisoli TaxID=400775 RepID=A0ABU0IPB4_9CAUL|nr:translation elongation factor Ts [Caulobacter ginsengisoli]MDQ0463018.1 elongation factor Ts [Caulobacter ginsengisoli]
MAEITAALVKDLREKSGAGMMDCKKALQENDGNIEASMDWLRTKGMAQAAKKADRAAAEGLVGVALKKDGKGMTGAVIELNAETDFVSRNELFQAAARKIADTALSVDGDVEAIKEAKTSDGEKIADLVTNLIATIGENMNLRRSARFSVAEGAVAAYIHNATAPELGRIGVLVAMEGPGDQDALQAVGKKIAMHVAATNPLSLSTDDLDPAAVEHERAILTEKAKEDGRPEAMIGKIVDGQIAKFQREVVLLKQAFVMNPDQTIEQLVAETSKAQGGPVSVKGFVRLALGEGVEKKVDDFAAEVASMTGGN